MATKSIVTRKPGAHRRRHIIFPAMHRLFNIEVMHEYGIDERGFTIYLEGHPRHYTDDPQGDFSEPGVEYQMASRFIKNLHILQGKNPKRPILIHMKTCGGSWEEGMAIYDAIRACPNNITICSHTHARSMSSMILQAADKRVLMPSSYFLFHEGTTGIEGTSKQVRTAIEWERKFVTPRMLDIYVASLRRKGKFKDWAANRIRKMLQQQMDKKEDVYLTAEEAVEWGFADEVFGANDRFDWGSLRKNY